MSHHQHHRHHYSLGAEIMADLDRQQRVFNFVLMLAFWGLVTLVALVVGPPIVALLL